jgi:imidazole glycerol-phosphate synthase subunit HisH
MKQPNIVIADYGVGNIHSIWNAVSALGYRKLLVSDSFEKLIASDALILPGVGAFAECANNLKQRHLDESLHEAVMVRRKPIIGICVGMQLMATFSEEGGRHEGLNWIPGAVGRLKLPMGYAVPHVGWNDIVPLRRDVLFSTLAETPDFYFDHSYHYQCDPSFILARCEYGLPLVAAIQREHIFGVQFHPEKSQNNGLKLFRAFFNAVSQC